MKVIHLTSGGDVGGAKTHVLSVVRGLNQTERAELVCFTEGAFAQEARALGIPTTVMDGGVLSTLKRLARRSTATAQGPICTGPCWADAWRCRS